MTIHDHQRYSLHQALDTHLGPENAATLLAYLPPVGWADVATKHDLTALEQRIGLRFDAMDHRLTAEIAGLWSELHKSLKTMTFTFVGATAAIVTVIAALTNLFS